MFMPIVYVRVFVVLRTMSFKIKSMYSRLRISSQNHFLCVGNNNTFFYVCQHYQIYRYCDFCEKQKLLSINKWTVNAIRVSNLQFILNGIN